MTMKGDRPGIVIPVAVSNDARSIASVPYESFVEFRASYTGEGFAATILTDNQIKARLKEAPMWVALDHDAIVGTISAIPKGDTLYIRSMAVLPRARGKGLGGLLLRQVEDFAAGHGYKRLFLSTTPFLTHAIRLYDAWGFRRSNEGPHDLHGTPLFTMVKTLGPID